MKLVLVTLLTVLLLAVESALLRPLGVGPARLDLQVAIILFLALHGSTLEGAFGSFLVGCLVDLYSGQPSGLYAFSSVVVYLGGRLVAPFVDVRSAWRFAPLAGVLDLLHNLVAWSLVLFTTAGGADRSAMLAAMPTTACFAALAALALWPLLNRLERLFKKPERGLL